MIFSDCKILAIPGVKLMNKGVKCLAMTPIWNVSNGCEAIVVFALFGLILGRAIDSRENIKDLIR